MLSWKRVKEEIEYKKEKEKYRKEGQAKNEIWMLIERKE